MHEPFEQLDAIMPTALSGTVVDTVGLSVAVADFPAPLGALVRIEQANRPSLEAEVVGFRQDYTLVCPLEDLTGIRRGQRVRLTRTVPSVRAGRGLLGRVVDCQGRPIDGQSEPAITQRIPINRTAPRPSERRRIDEPLATGVRAIDGMLCCGQGQRMGIFAPAGAGKSVLLGRLARDSTADVNIVALIGERGREVHEFLEQHLGSAGLARSVVVVATSEEPASQRVRAALAATALAESFRDQGCRVLLLMDSLSRLAQAQREIALAAGEPPAARGYPPSVWALLPRVLERAGATAAGSITGFYSVLTEGPADDDPVSEALHSLLDGHLCLSRSLAARGHFPAIDVLRSLSRLMPSVSDTAHQNAAAIVRTLLSDYEAHEDLISIGAYRAGTHPRVNAAISLRDEVLRYLAQEVHRPTTRQAARDQLLRLQERYEAALRSPQANQAS